MVKVTDKDIYMDGFAQKNLDVAKEVNRKDWDAINLIDGTEGAGKSVLAQQFAYYLDPTFNIDRIVFTANDFKDSVLKADKYQAIIYDEAYSGLSSRGTMSEVNKILVSMLAEIRQKNLFIFIVMPTFFDLDKYVAIWRSRVLIHVYAVDWERGYFMWFDSHRKKVLYLLGKKLYDYNVTKANFVGRFAAKDNGGYIVDQIEYRNKKRKALESRKDTKEVKAEYRFKVTLAALCNHVPLRKASDELKDLGLELTFQRIGQLIEEYKRERDGVEL